MADSKIIELSINMVSGHQLLHKLYHGKIIKRSPFLRNYYYSLKDRAKTKGMNDTACLKNHDSLLTMHTLRYLDYKMNRIPKK